MRADASGSTTVECAKPGGKGDGGSSGFAAWLWPGVRRPCGRGQGHLASATARGSECLRDRRIIRQAAPKQDSVDHAVAGAVQFSLHAGATIRQCRRCDHCGHPSESPVGLSGARAGVPDAGVVSIHHVPAPQPRSWIRLPDQAGTIRGTITLIEGRPDGSTWVGLSCPQWVRTEENLTPGHAIMWAPLGSVQVMGSDDLKQTLSLIRRVAT